MQYQVNGWVARNKCGELKLFRTFPLRQSESEAFDNYGDGCMDYVYYPSVRWDAGGGDHGMTLPYHLFPEVTWDSEPIEVSFTID